MNFVFSQVNDETLKANPMQELLGTNTKILGLKGTVKEMQEQQFTLDAKGKKTSDSLVFSNLYKFNKEGLTTECEQNYKALQSKKFFFSYTNQGYISHVDIETIHFTGKDTSDTWINQSATPNYSTVDYKYVKKKNILYKGEEQIAGFPKKVNSRNEYFYHFNEEDKITQIDDQTLDYTAKYEYASNDLVKEVQTFKSGTAFNKKNYKYDRNNRIINVATINLKSNTKEPNQEIIISYKLDENGNIIEKKLRTYSYAPNGTKEFLESYLYEYKYIY
jgi:hypothetical protein